jgi:hypothetical protein
VSMLIDLDSLTRDELLDLLRQRGQEPVVDLGDDVLALARANHLTVWQSRFTVRKWFDAQTEEETVGLAPDEVVEKERNLLAYGGCSCLWECLIGNGTTTAGQALTYFNNANAAIGVGDSSTAPAATQTDLQAATNKVRVGQAATYPQHTDGTTAAANTITFQSSFPASGGTAANYAWNEVGIFNSATAGTGRMLNRLAPAGGFGTKSGGTWSMSVALTIS